MKACHIHPYKYCRVHMEHISKPETLNILPLAKCTSVYRFIHMSDLRVRVWAFRLKGPSLHPPVEV